MEHRFLSAVDAAVTRALPDGWPRFPRAWLPARGAVRARHAFRLADGTGPAPWLAIVALPQWAASIPATQRDLIALVDQVLARGASLLLLEEHSDAHPDGWTPEHLDFPHPRFLWLPCIPAAEALGLGLGPGGGGIRESEARDDGPEREQYLAEPCCDRWEPLAEIIHDLWSGDLFYRGPCEGAQTVGLEIMKSDCWRCRAALEVVTGIVFPDREVGDWSLPDWSYYQGLLALAAIPDALIPALSAAVDSWRAEGDRRLSVIRWRHGKTVQRSYWAAECTACGAFQGDLPVTERRLRWLDDLAARRGGILSYRPLRLDVPRQALQELAWGAEAGPHCRPLGWRRAGDPDLDGPPAALLITAALPATPATAAGAPACPPAPPPPPPPPISPIAAARPGAGPMQRLGEIFSSWLGR
jgi:hypothetical protein